MPLFADMFQAEFENILKRLMDTWEVPGVSIALTTPSGKLVTKCYGDQAIGTPVTSQVSSPFPLLKAGLYLYLKTRFPVASVSKTIAAFAVGKALHEGGYDLGFQTPVQTILPLFKLQGNDSAQVTVRDILSHQCRVADYNLLTLRALEGDETIVSSVAQRLGKKHLQLGHAHLAA